jgi:hypothetical protein
MRCDDDKVASRRAENLAKAEAADIELWQGARMVAKLLQKRQFNA